MDSEKRFVEIFGVERPRQQCCPGEIEIPLFKDRINEAHKVSQVGFVLVSIPDMNEANTIAQLKEVMRSVDSFCVPRPGTILILIAKQPDIRAVEQVVKKIKTQLANIPGLYVKGLFVPYPAIDYRDILYTLEAKDDQQQEEFGIIIHQHQMCWQCTEKHCILRDELKATMCAGLQEYKGLNNDEEVD